MLAFKNKSIICFGEVLWDMLPTGANAGGAPLNVAVHLKRQGLSPNLISRIGNDKLGQELIDFLKTEGIDTDTIQTDKTLPTSQVLVHLDKDNNATYEICHPVAWDNILSNKTLSGLAEQAGLIVFGSLASRDTTTRNTLKQLLKNNTTKLFDVNLRPPYNSKEIIEEFLQISEMVKLNDDELLEIAGWYGKSGTEKELTTWISEKFECELVCITRGANGALLYFENKFYENMGFKVTTVDTVGAGDSFLAGLIGSLMNQQTPDKALEYACATGAFVASKAGATPNYTSKDIYQFIS